MAKSVEDTAFYRYHRLIALNEVGGNPAQFGVPVERFHAESAERWRSWPLSMTTSSTHDTKRGEDAASVLSVLTEMPDEWQRTVTLWATLGEQHKTARDGASMPSRSDEYLFYQALIGAWPFGWDGEADRAGFSERMQAFMQKATHEAKQETSWMAPDAAYDAAVLAFVQGILEDAAFRQSAGGFVRRLGTYAATNGLAKTLLRLCSPGVPDTYQGAELWNQSLVDPDNRRAVDYGQRRALLEGLREPADRSLLIERLLQSWTDGAIKLYVVQVALQIRKQMQDLFRQGDYVALPAGEHAIAFSRTHEGRSIVTVVPRLPLRLTRGERPWPLGDVWAEQRLVLPARSFSNAFTGELIASQGSVRLADCFATFPVALLVAERA
jgi:(1->4)-alpha-D-glucan 1-alpha-D-glucosylmutase